MGRKGGARKEGEKERWESKVAKEGKKVGLEGKVERKGKERKEGEKGGWEGKAEREGKKGG